MNNQQDNQTLDKQAQLILNQTRALQQLPSKETVQKLQAILDSAVAGEKIVEEYAQKKMTLPTKATKALQCVAASLLAVANGKSSRDIPHVGAVASHATKAVINMANNWPNDKGRVTGMKGARYIDKYSAQKIRKEHMDTAVMLSSHTFAQIFSHKMGERQRILALGLTVRAIAIWAILEYHKPIN